MKGGIEGGGQGKRKNGKKQKTKWSRPSRPVTCCLPQMPPSGGHRRQHRGSCTTQEKERAKTPAAYCHLPHILRVLPRCHQGAKPSQARPFVPAAWPVQASSSSVEATSVWPLSLLATCEKSIAKIKLDSTKNNLRAYLQFCAVGIEVHEFPLIQLDLLLGARGREIGGDCQLGRLATLRKIHRPPLRWLIQLNLSWL